MGYCPWGCKKSDMTEGLTLSLLQILSSPATNMCFMMYTSSIFFQLILTIPSTPKCREQLCSVSSAPNAHPGEVHLTVAVLAYRTQGEAGEGGRGRDPAVTPGAGCGGAGPSPVALSLLPTP